VCVCVGGEEGREPNGSRGIYIIGLHIIYDISYLFIVCVILRNDRGRERERRVCCSTSS